MKKLFAAAFLVLLVLFVAVVGIAFAQESATKGFNLVVFVTAAIAWVKTNWLQIAGVYAALVTAASYIVRFTPTIKDDNALLAIIKFMSRWIALNRTVDDAAVRAGPAK